MPPAFDSYAQNREDVILFRALGHIRTGRYIDVGAYHPIDDSISWAFYQRGWRGISFEPVHELAELHRQLRPKDQLVEAVVTGTTDQSVTLHKIDGTGLSTLLDRVRDVHQHVGMQAHDVKVDAVRLDDVLDRSGWEGQDIHFMTVDTEGSESDVLDTIDLTRWRPWVLVIEATAPTTTTPTFQGWEPKVLQAGYEFCLFDGLSRFYVAAEHADDLADPLRVPANVLDEYRSPPVRAVSERNVKLTSEVAQLRRDATRWRTVALEGWLDAVETTQNSSEDRAELDRLRQVHHGLVLEQQRAALEHQRVAAEVEAIHSTLSWRSTKILRAARGWTPKSKR
jgi:FkbM family methyltransferase